MVDKIGPIKNPLTIIAMFAAIAEISGTVVLPFIAEANQAVYVWFLMIFPFLLIILFFVTLNFNHKVLYAPSDYQNEDNFLQSLPRATFAEKALKLEAEIAEVVVSETEGATAESQASVTAEEVPAERPSSPAEVSSNGPSASSAPFIFQSIVRQSPRASFILAEELVFKKLRKEFATEIQRELKLGAYVFDGIVRDKGVTTAVEVKFVRNGTMSSGLLRAALQRIQNGARALPSEQASNFRVLLAFVDEDNSINRDKLAFRVDYLRSEFSFPIEVRFYNLLELQREFAISE